jgi:hypothetical protein
MGIYEFIGSIGGITGVLAFAIFMIYRQDKQATEQRINNERSCMEQRYSELVTKISEDYSQTIAQRDAVMRDFTKATMENTKVMSELYAWLRGKNGHGQRTLD